MIPGWLAQAFQARDEAEAARDEAVAATSSTVSVLTYGADPTGATDSTAAFQEAMLHGKLIRVPAGRYMIDAPAATRVGPSDGAGVFMDASASGVSFVGDGVGATTIFPASNSVNPFLIVGASDVAFSGIHFDNSSNGILQNTPKGPDYEPNTGVAGLGNSANSAVMQFSGEGLTVTHCKFTEWNTGVAYVGDNSDTSILSGDLFLDGCDFNGCVFGVLPRQPRNIILVNSNSVDTTDSVNFGGTVDPGHMLYVTDRSGAYPVNIVVSNITDEGGTSSAIKVRKGVNVSLSNITSTNSGNGAFEAYTCQYLTISNVSSKLSVPAAINASAARIIDCGYVEASNLVLDIRGTGMWGLRIQPELTGASIRPWMNRGLRISGVTIIDDNLGANDKAQIVMIGQTEATIDRFRYIHEGSVASTRYPIDIRESSRVRISRPAHIAPSGPSDAARLVSLDANCSGCIIDYLSTDLDVDPNPSATVLNNGTGTKIRVDGILNGDLFANRFSAKDVDGYTGILEGNTLKFSGGGAPYIESMSSGGTLAIRTASTIQLSTAGSEWLRLNTDGSLRHRANATTIIDPSSHLGLRAYTVATLPPATTSARMIYVSDGSSGRRLAVSDGVNWVWGDGTIVS